MPLQKELKSEIEKYCNNHLPPDSWYEDEFSSLLDLHINSMRELGQKAKT